MLGGRVGGRGVHVALARDPARGGHVDDDAAAAPRLAGHVPRAGLQAVVDPLLQPGTESQCTVGQFSHFCPMGVLGLFILSKYLHCAMYEQV